LYALQDANGNVTALVDTSGNVVERYLYQPYENVTVLTGSWGSRSSSSYDWRILFQAKGFDSTVNLYDSRHRDYSPTVARWTQQDPLGFAAGDLDLYRFVFDNPTAYTDPSGLDVAFLLDPKINLGVGHGGLLVGPLKGDGIGSAGPYYFVLQFGAGRNWTTNKDNFSSKRFDTLKEALEFAKKEGFTQMGTWLTGPATAEIAAGAAWAAYWGTNYNLLNHNCIGAVGVGLNACGIANLPGPVPFELPDKYFKKWTKVPGCKVQKIDDAIKGLK
jgi:RHS repeat-associated protein